MSDNSSSRALLQSLGLCAKAGKLVFGTDMVCTEMRKNASRLLLVIEAADTSENTHKKISDKTAYYSVEHIRVSLSAEEIGHATGKMRPVAVLALTDSGLVSLVKSKL